MRALRYYDEARVMQRSGRLPARFIYLFISFLAKHTDKVEGSQNEGRGP